MSPMKRIFPALILSLAATPALAESEPFFTIHNTHFVVLIAFVIFLGVLIYLKVPGLLARMLDERANTIRGELDEAKALRDEAQAILAGYERKKAEVEEHAQKIVERARIEAEEAAADAKAALASSIERRLRGAEEQIASANAAALREVRDRAIEIAVSAAAEVMSKSMTAQKANALIDASIKEVKDRLH